MSKAKSLALLLLLVGAASGQLIDGGIAKYIERGEDYSTFEILVQTPSGPQLAHVLVLVNEAPAFILLANGSLVENQTVILSVSEDYVNSRPAGSGVSSAESIAASITLETQSRKEKSIIREASETAVRTVASLRNKTAAMKSTLPGVDFAKMEEKLFTLEKNASEIGKSTSVDRAIALNESFYSEFNIFSQFFQALNRSYVKLGSALNATREARVILNNKIVSVGRDDTAVLESQRELSEVEALLNSEINKIETLTSALDERSIHTALEKSQALLAKVREVKGGESNLLSIALLILVVIAILGGVVLYFKKLREKQTKEESEGTQ